MSSTPLYKVQAELSLGKKTYGVQSVQYRTTINSWPSIYVELLINSSASTNVVDVNGKLMSELKPFRKLDQTYNLKFGCDGQMAEVTCIAKSVQITISKPNTKISLVLTPEYTRVDELNLGIFKLVPALSANDIDGGKDTPKIEKNSIIDYTRIVYKQSREKWEKHKENYFGGTNPPALQKTVEFKDKRNQKLYSIFEQLLDNSMDTVGDLYDIESNLKADAKKPKNLAQAIRSILFQDSNSFLSIICGLANIFGLVYVPGLNDVGYFLPKSKMVVDGEKGNMEGAKIIAADINLGSVGINPIGYVYSKSKSYDIDAGKTAKGRVLNTFATFPEDISDSESASSLSCPPPSWAPEFNAAQGVEASGDPSNKGKTPSKKGITEKDTKEYKYCLTEILKEWCRQHFYFQRYSPQYADVMSLYVLTQDSFGKVIDIKDNENTNMFTGFVQTYELFLRKEVGQRGGDIYTKFTLSCVLLEGEEPIS